jgi:hypothetical protein
MSNLNSISMTTMFYYPAKGAVVATANIEFARCKARKIMQRSIVVKTLPQHIVSKFKAKFTKKG